MSTLICHLYVVKGEIQKRWSGLEHKESNYLWSRGLWDKHKQDKNLIKVRGLPSKPISNVKMTSFFFDDVTSY